ncbi:MAG TPA: winged helix-turn-helix domain-containing protein [Solirubrobacterales bacterium]|nr:winged helix-turn-helix domain-containing protein [Solirubrobacterales bacterium]
MVKEAASKAKKARKDKKARKARKRIEEVVQFALAHKTRVHILILLNEGDHTAGELAEMIDEPLNNVHSHLSAMLDDGSIEIADEERKRNMTLYWYRAVETSCYQQHEFEKLPFLQRQNITGAILQSGSAEVMAGFYAGSLADPHACCYWDWYNLDSKGREDAEDLNLRYLKEYEQIETESEERSGDETTSMLVNVKYFQRGRKGLSHAQRACQVGNH